MNKTSAFKKALDKVLKENDERITKLAEEFRSEVLIPLCKKHQLRFTSGMGMYFFTTKKVTYIERDEDFENHPHLKDELKPIFDLLDEEISHGQHFGYCVSDISSKDIK